MRSNRNHIKVFVASTVHNFEFQLRQVYDLLDGYGYDVLISHRGTIPLDSQQSNLLNCTNAVEECDVFIGFIRPDYGTSVQEVGGDSITHAEFKTAFLRNIPRFILADYRVVFARSLFKDGYFIDHNLCRRVDFNQISLEKSSVMDTRCIQMYNESIQDNSIKNSKQQGNWVQEYVDFNDVKMHLDSQFKYPDRIQKLIDHSEGAEHG